MKILHTSDWHLGRTLHKVDLHEHQAAFLDWLVDLVEAEGVDVVVIPGDVYDRAVPAVSSVTLLDQALARLADTGATVVLTSGNHDSPERLGFGRSLMRAGIHLLTDLPGIEHPVSVEDEHGEVLFFGLPYLEPDRARTELAREGEGPPTDGVRPPGRDLQRRGRAHRDGGLAQDQVVALQVRHQRIDHRLHVPGVRRVRTALLRGAHADEVHVGKGGGFVVVGGEVQAAGCDVALEHLGKPRLEKRHLRMLQRLDFGFIHVNAQHLVAQLRHARSMRRAEVTSANHSHPHKWPLCRGGAHVAGRRGGGVDRLALSAGR